MKSRSIIPTKRNLFSVRRRFAVAAVLVGALVCALVFVDPIIEDQPDSDALWARNSTTKLFFAGDIMLDRGVKSKIVAAGDPGLPFKNVAGEIWQADISFANLESAFFPKSSSRNLVFNAEPDSVSGLRLAGFDILSTANNHTFDHGRAGLDFTYKWLNENSILPLGTSDTCHQGQIISRNNIKFGFLAYSYTATNDGGIITNSSVCDANDLRQVTNDIRNLRWKVDVLIVSVHMGDEYTRTPNAFGVKFAHNAIDSGADLLIGHHPHWIQGVERYKNKWIFYSLGNFVFDQMWSENTREGLTVEVSFKGKTLNKIELRPVIIENYCCPRWADESETKSILDKIGLTNPILTQ